MRHEDKDASRRQFLKWLSASPMLAVPGMDVRAAEALSAGSKLPDPIIWSMTQLQ